MSAGIIESEAYADEISRSRIVGKRDRKAPLAGLRAARLSNTPGGNPRMGDDCAKAGEHTPKAIEARAIRNVRSLRESVAVKPLIWLAG